MDQTSIKTPNLKCRFYWCLIEFTVHTVLEIQSVMSVFWTPLVNQRPSNLLTGSTSPLPCVNKYRGMYCIYTVCNKGGDRVVCGEHIQELFTVYLTRFRTYKITCRPKQNPRRAGGLRQINTCRKVR